MSRKRAWVTRTPSGQIVGVFRSCDSETERSAKKRGLCITNEDQGEALAEWLEAADEAELSKTRGAK